MKQNLIDQYNQISEKRDAVLKEYDDEISSRLISDLLRVLDKVSSDDETDSGRRELEQKRAVARLAFAELRLRINCELISEEEYFFRDQMKEDLETIIGAVKEITYSWDIDDELLLEVIQVLDLLCAEYRKIIISVFPGRQFLFYEQPENVSADLFYAATEMAQCFIEHGYYAPAGNVIEKLCFKSRILNSESSHTELVSRCIPIILEACPDTVFRICEKNSELFEGRPTIEAGDFFWYYAAAAIALEKTDVVNGSLRQAITVRRKVLGPDSWYTAIAECELAIQNMENSRDPVMRKYLFDFVDTIEKKQYDDMNPDYAVVLEGRILFILLHDDPDMESLEKYEYYVSLFEKVCYAEKPVPTSQNARAALNLRGAFCIRTGDYIRAEQCFLEALKCNTDDRVLTDALIKSNLLIVYRLQNDLEHAFQLAAELFTLIDSGQDSGLSPADEYRIQNIYVSLLFFIDADKDELDEILQIVRDECGNVIRESKDLNETDKERVSFIVNTVGLLVEKEWVDREDYRTFYSALNIIRQYREKLLFEQRRNVLLDLTLSILALELEQPTTEFYIKETLAALEHFEVSAEIRVSAYFVSGVYYALQGQPGRAERYLRNACSELTNAWHSSVRYLNDTRLMNSLVTAQIQYASIYAAERQILSLGSCYDHLLRFKMLASLSGRERNRIIHAGSVDQEMMEKIRQKQDHIAALESDTMANTDASVIEKARTELRALEAEFAEKFPTNFDFTEISLKNVMRMLPDDSAVIEYFDTVSNYGKTAFEDTDIEQCIDIYILRKLGGRCSLGRKVIAKGEQVLSKAEKLTGIYQAMSGGEATTQQLSEFENLKSSLFEDMIAPLLEEIRGAQTLYIAPCSALINIPFGLLGNEQTGRFQDHWKILKIECARDFLFANRNDSLPAGKNLVMGDPAYSIREQIKLNEHTENDRQRSIDLADNKIRPLPFSGIEALRIRMRIGADCYTGISATKNRLFSGNKYRNIHIATHGWVDYDGGADTLFSSCLFLAGAQNWLENREMNAETGNGIVTADEISRQNWSGVNLIVLSACMSGMNDYTVNKGFNGMVSALSAAGVRYVISSLWKLDDLGTAIMMEEFYRCYIIEKKSPVEALSCAQAYLRNITVGEIRAAGWLNITDVRIKPVIERFEQLSNQRKPFRDEIFWGGFECYRCN